MIRCVGILLFFSLFSPLLSEAELPDIELGKRIYNERCHWCHGEDGEATVIAAKRMSPPPRAFTEGWYKIKSSGLDDSVPSDEDIFKSIANGMPGTAMPGWRDVLSDDEIRALVFYLKSFAGYEEERAEGSIDYGKKIAASLESILKGKVLFVDRCAECHGESGKGVSIKKMKDDLGYRTWPRNLTKPWTFIGGSLPEDIFIRISSGIPGTQMPSFADPASQKKLSTEERWHIVNYVTSIEEKELVVKGENNVVKVERVEGELPDSPEDEKWSKAESSTFYLLPQIIAKDRFFKPSNDTISARGLYNDKELAMLIEWDDRTKSIPGDKDAANVADENFFEDAVSIQWPIDIPDGMEKPYFGMGDATHPVNLWQWKSGTTETAESVTLFNARGFGSIEQRNADHAGLTGKGLYDKGTWRVVMKRPLNTDDAGKDLQIVEGKFIPVAFAAWDGSNGEKGSKHTMTTWYWVLLKPAVGIKVYLIPLLVTLFVVVMEIWWLKGLRKKNLK